MQQLGTSSLTNQEAPISHPKRNLKDEERQAILEYLLKQSHDGKSKKGSIVTISRQFSVSKKTVQRIWRQYRSHNSEISRTVASKKTGRVGRKRVEVDMAQICQVPLRKRTTIRSLSHALCMSKSTVHRRIKEGSIRSHTNAVKPFLTDENKKSRLEFCLSMIDPISLTVAPLFKDMFNIVHIDEKWFIKTNPCQRYYLHQHEKEPIRTCKSKRFIPKIMFLADVARPRFDSMGNCEFSGKIGIFPFVFKEPAKRNSKNRVAGTMETKPILSVTKEVVRAALIEKVLPAIHAKWPRNMQGPIIIQQDNAKPHIDSSDVQFLQAARKDGFDVRLANQPPNSPDMNVLDLGFFRAIQSLKDQKAPNTIDELIDAVEEAFEELSPQCLNHVFLSLQLCMTEVMKIKGGNDYKLPHIGKNSLEREDNLSLQIACDPNLIQDCLAHLNQVN